MSTIEQDQEGLRRAIGALTLVARIGALLKLNPDAITADSVEPEIMDALTKRAEARDHAIRASFSEVRAREEAALLRDEVIRLQAALKMKSGVIETIGAMSSDKQVRELVKSSANRLDELEAHCRAYIKEQEIRGPESAHQTDRVAETSGAFIKGICDIVGYHKD